MASPGLQLQESQIRYAMENSCTNSEAAKWLHITAATFKKYALRYIDEPSGKTLWLLHKERGAAKRLVLPVTRYRRLHTVPWAFQPYPIADIFANKHPKYSLRRFYDRIVKEGFIEERCTCCGFQERRLHDYEIPLKLHWIDGDRHNYAIENIQMLCFNCYFITVGNPWGGEKKYVIDEVTGEPVPYKRDRKAVKSQQVSIQRVPYAKRNKT